MFSVAASSLRMVKAASVSAKITMSMARMAFLSTSADKLQGTVKWFDVKKGFGFISPADGSEDVFVHQSHIKAQGFRSLADGESVEFTLTTNADKGGKKFATNVTGPDGSFVKGVQKPQQQQQQYQPRDRDQGRERRFRRN